MASPDEHATERRATGQSLRVGKDTRLGDLPRRWLGERAEKAALVKVLDEIVTDARPSDEASGRTVLERHCRPLTIGQGHGSRFVSKATDRVSAAVETQSSPEVMPLHSGKMSKEEQALT